MKTDLSLAVYDKLLSMPVSAFQSSTSSTGDAQMIDRQTVIQTEIACVCEVKEVFGSVNNILCKTSYSPE